MCAARFSWQPHLCHSVDVSSYGCGLFVWYAINLVIYFCFHIFIGLKELPFWVSLARTHKGIDVLPFFSQCRTRECAAFCFTLVLR